MTSPGDCKPTSDHVETALDASCGTLIALESIRARMTDAAVDLRSLQELITEATESLTRAIGELRLAREERASALAHGFVLRAGPR
jgi:hypothetical protein